jgi:hypothetical protein
LVKEGIITKQESEEDDIKLYMDLLGAITTAGKFLGMPIEEQTALTTFEDAKIIYQELKEAGISNQVIRYLGWMNGGLRATAPAKIKVEKVLGGEAALKELVSYLQGEGREIFFDIDFSYLNRMESFDGFDMDWHTSKTIDNKPAFLKTYNPVTQSFNEGRAFVLSPYSITEFYGEIKDKYTSFFGEGEKSISLGSLGFALNSSQDEDRPLNREDSKNEIIGALEQIAKDYNNVLVENGNYYTWQYANNVLDIPLDSSNRRTTTDEIPFLGIVLHGYMNYAGEAINLAGDYEYTLLKTIENGANPYFVLGYENISSLKTNGFSEYYAVEYGIWKESIIEEYNKLNTVLAPLQNHTISSHEILDNRIVKVGYSNGTKILLNYTNFDVKVDGKTIEAMGFLVQA